jgi:hypothetical protein
MQQLPQLLDILQQRSGMYFALRSRQRGNVVAIFGVLMS